MLRIKVKDTEVECLWQGLTVPPDVGEKIDVWPHDMRHVATFAFLRKSLKVLLTTGPQRAEDFYYHATVSYILKNIRASIDLTKLWPQAGPRVEQLMRAIHARHWGVEAAARVFQAEGWIFEPTSPDARTCPGCGLHYTPTIRVWRNGDLTPSGRRRSSGSVCPCCSTACNDAGALMPAVRRCNACHDWYTGMPDDSNCCDKCNNMVCPVCSRRFSILTGVQSYRENTVYYCGTLCRSQREHQCGCGRWHRNGTECEECRYMVFDYSVKIPPMFKGDTDKCHFGIELEFGSPMGERETVTPIKDALGDHVYFKRDGTILRISEATRWIGEDEASFLSSRMRRDVELVTHPFTLKYWQDEFMPKFTPILLSLISRGCRSWDLGTCGLHVHVDKAFVLPKIQRIMQLLLADGPWTLRMSGRHSQDHLQGYANMRFGATPDTATHALNSHYSGVNTSPPSTVEFRIWAGTLRPQSVQATVELTAAIVDFAALPLAPTVDTFTEWLNSVDTVYPMAAAMLNKKLCRMEA